MKKMSKLMFVAAATLLVGGLASCNGGDTEKEYALITDVGNIDDQSFNQTCYEALVAFAKAKGKTYDYYRPTEDSNESRMISIDQAVQKGAKIVVCPGYLFEPAVYKKQAQYPEVKFVLIDGTPHAGDYATYETKANTVSVIFQEQISGFLAGYAAVKDGNKDLGFCGGSAVPAVQRFGSGFVQGCDFASKEMGIQTTLKYYYAGAFEPTDAATSTMKSWYTAGIDTVFASGGKVYQSVVEGAKSGKAGSTWIGVDTDQNHLDPDKVLTSAVKGLAETVTSALEVYYNDKWSEISGKNYNLGLAAEFGSIAAKDYVGIPTTDSSWKFKTFTKTELESIKSDIKSGKVAVSGDTSAAPETTNCKVSWVSAFTGSSN